MASPLSVSAQMVEVREYRGRKVQCIHSGILPTNGTECGTQHYARVFSGTVKSAFDIGETDKLLQLVPDEVFLGDPATEVMAVTNQACLRREIRTGEKWLFYLYRDTRTNGLVLPYDSPSKPMAGAQKDIATLRHVSKLTDTGILTGRVGRPNHKVVATRVSDGKEFSVVTNGDGDFELELAPGMYRVSANTIQGLWGPDAEPTIPNRGCIHVNFWMHIDGRIVGSVTTPDGKPARYVNVAIIPVSAPDQAFTVLTDSQGHFEVGGRQPGQYLVGVGLLAAVNSAEWAARVYYPGVRTQEQAKVIELGKGEWRTDVSFKLLPPPTAP
jgi:hypothetical protein